MLKITKKNFIEIIEVIGNQYFYYSQSVDCWTVMNRQTGLNTLRAAEKIEKINSLPKYYETNEFGLIINCH